MTCPASATGMAMLGCCAAAPSHVVGSIYGAHLGQGFNLIGTDCFLTCTKTETGTLYDYFSGLAVSTGRYTQVWRKHRTRTVPISRFAVYTITTTNLSMADIITYTGGPPMAEGTVINPIDPSDIVADYMLLNHLVVDDAPTILGPTQHSFRRRVYSDPNGILVWDGTVDIALSDLYSSAQMAADVSTLLAAFPLPTSTPLTNRSFGSVAHFSGAGLPELTAVWDNPFPPQPNYPSFSIFNNSNLGGEGILKSGNVNIQSAFKEAFKSWPVRRTDIGACATSLYGPIAGNIYTYSTYSFGALPPPTITPLVVQSGQTTILAADAIRQILFA